MRSNNFIQILLGALLAVQVCPKAAAQYHVTLTVCASDFSVIGGPLNKNVDSSTLAIFSAAGTQTSHMDYSTVSGAQMCSYGNGTFKGSGRLDSVVGSYAGEPSAEATGETSVYIIFQITNSFNYEFASSCSASGNVFGYVAFNGLSNGDGTLLKNGTIGPAEYVLQADMGTGQGLNSGNGTWSYSLSLMPANIPAGRFTQAEKSSFWKDATVLSTLANQMMILAYSSPTSAMRAALLAATESLGTKIDQLKQDFLDPLDTNYTALAEAVAPTVTPLAAGGGITQLEANDYNLWATNLAQSAEYSTALTTSINRAQGAAFAGNSYWETAQMNAAVQFEAQLASVADQEPTLRSNVVAQFASDGFLAITVTSNDVIDLQNDIATNGLPAVLLEGLTGVGASLCLITNLEDALLTQDPVAIAGSFPESLANTNIDSAEQAPAAGLRDASLTLINASLLPGGQFRFDLPTDPGYTYTIQFTENLATPPGWTTIFTTNATTALLSFTNTSPKSGRAGLYRATHN